jgi:hypothetical protein
MLHPESDLFRRLLSKIESMPVIDCHEHMRGFAARPTYEEPISALTLGYVASDLHSAGLGVPESEILRLQDQSVSTDAKWPLFERLWRATEHTAYARVTKLILRDVYGVTAMSRDALDVVAAQLPNQDEAAYVRAIEQSGIKLILSDVLGDFLTPLTDGLASFLDGSSRYRAEWRLLISLPVLHPTNLTRERIETIGSLADRAITSLDEFLGAVYAIFERCKERGAVGIKDQSAYGRVLSYDLVAKATAEQQFNLIVGDPRNTLGWPRGKPLNDFLFHEYMRFARDLDLPVQLHTGHMAGIRNRVDKTNAAHLANVLELHRDVRFDIFHGNWPYLGDLLFLGKNYPNVALDCCWLHIIDPDYASQLLERSVMTLPHTKVHGFGGDYGDYPEYVAAHLRIARHNIAATLCRTVERGWLAEQEALTIAADWLYNNPNRFFRLGQPEYAV